MDLPIPFCQQTNRVVSHPIPLHPDEIVAYYAMRRFGLTYFPDIANADFVFRTDQEPLFEGKTWQEHRAEGTVCLGTNGGPFDEHPFGDEPRKERETTASLIAKYLGVTEKPELRLILGYVLKNDLHAERDDPLMDFAESVRCSFVFPVMAPKQALFMHLCNLESIYCGQQKFQAAADDLRRAKTIRVKASHREYVIITAMTKNEDFTKYVRSKQANTKVSLIIIKNPETDGMFISPRKGYVEQTHIDHIARIVRLAENKHRNRSSALDMFELTKEGSTDETPEWYFVHDNLHNRRVPSAIPLEELTELIAAVLSRNIKSA